MKAAGMRVGGAPFVQDPAPPHRLQVPRGLDLCVEPLPVFSPGAVYLVGG